MKVVIEKKQTEYNYDKNSIIELIQQAHIEEINLNNVLEPRMYTYLEERIETALKKVDTNEKKIEFIIKKYSLGHLSGDCFDKYLQEYTTPFANLTSKKNNFETLLKKLEALDAKLIYTLDGHKSALGISSNKLGEHMFTGLLKTEYKNDVGYIIFKDGKIVLAVSKLNSSETDMNSYFEESLKRIWANSYSDECKMYIMGELKPNVLENILNEFPKFGLNSSKTESSKKDIKRRTRFSLDWGVSPSTEKKDEEPSDYEKIKSNLAEELRLERCSKMLAAVVLLTDDKERLRILMTEGISPTDFSNELKNAVDKRKEKERTNEISPAEKASILEDELMAELAELDEAKEDQILREIDDLEDL